MTDAEAAEEIRKEMRTEEWPEWRKNAQRLVDALDALVAHMDWDDATADVNTKLGRAQRIAALWKKSRPGLTYIILGGDGKVLE